MYLSQINLVNFKNYKLLSLSFGKGINCITGNNGLGKTNVLDAIYLLSNTKSYFNAYDHQLVMTGNTEFGLKADYISEKDGEFDVSCKFGEKKKKVLKKSGKAYTKLAEHIGLIPAIFISPTDISLIYGIAADRRKFLDGIISQFDRVYLSNLLKYNKLLDRRNSLLKEMRENRNPSYQDVLQAIDNQILPISDLIKSRREEVLVTIGKYFSQIHSKITLGLDVVSFKYYSGLEGKLTSELFSNNNKVDVVSGRTSGGIHKDDIIFKIDGKAIKKFGSQGQIKSYLLALKIAGYLYLQSQSKVKPILLLDDIFEKIDEDRSQALLNILETDDFGQIFITDTHEDRLRKQIKMVKKDKRFFTEKDLIQ